MTLDVPQWVYPLVGGILFLALAMWGVLVWRERRRWGNMDATIRSVAHDVLKNVLISNGMDEQIYLPYLLLTERGLVVLDLVERPGSIFGGDQMTAWTSIGKKRRYTFPNPQHTLYDRMAAVKLLANNTPVDGRIVFTKRSEFPKGKPKYVLRIDELATQFSIVDRNRDNIMSAFSNVWQHIKNNAKSSPLSIR
jgi:hypothetical protein